MVGFGLLLLMPSQAPRGGARREWCSSTEPTTGLDPQSRANLWTHIRSLRDELGVTVQLRTHYLAKAGALADRILVMDGGLFVADDTPDALKARIAGDVVTLQLGGANRRAGGPDRRQPGRACPRGHLRRQHCPGQRRRRRRRGRPAAACDGRSRPEPDLGRRYPPHPG